MIQLIFVANLGGRWRLRSGVPSPPCVGACRWRWSIRQLCGQPSRGRWGPWGWRPPHRLRNCAPSVPPAPWAQCSLLRRLGWCCALPAGQTTAHCLLINCLRPRLWIQSSEHTVLKIIHWEVIHRRVHHLILKSLLATKLGLRRGIWGSDSIECSTPPMLLIIITAATVVSWERWVA